MVPQIYARKALQHLTYPFIAGGGPKALQQIINYRVSGIVYVSCNPKTLVENLQHMISTGYKVERMKLVGMFTHACHAETVVLLAK